MVFPITGNTNKEEVYFMVGGGGLSERRIFQEESNLKTHPTYPKNQQTNNKNKGITHTQHKIVLLISGLFLLLLTFILQKEV